MHRSLLRYALAHHPTCDRFAPDIIVVRARNHKLPLCSGCIVFWPLLLLGVPIILAFAARFQITWWWPATMGLLLGSAQILSYLRLTRTKPVKLLVKSSFGAGAAAVVSGLILAPWPAFLRLGIALVLVTAALLFQTRRLRSITTVCDSCPWNRDWQHCPGFSPLNDHVSGRLPEGTNRPGPGLPQAWPWKRRIQGRR